MPMCDWCGADHPVAQLCHARPKWSRRGFVSLLGAGLVGVCVPSLAVSDPALSYFSPAEMVPNLSFNVSPSGRVFTYDAHTIRSLVELERVGAR